MNTKTLYHTTRTITQSARYLDNSAAIDIRTCIYTKIKYKTSINIQTLITKNFLGFFYFICGAYLGQSKADKHL